MYVNRVGLWQKSGYDYSYIQTWLHMHSVIEESKRQTSRNVNPMVRLGMSIVLIIYLQRASIEILYFESGDGMKTNYNH